jgi:hypothetical protein
MTAPPPRVGYPGQEVRQVHVTGQVNGVIMAGKMTGGRAGYGILAGNMADRPPARKIGSCR